MKSCPYRGKPRCTGNISRFIRAVRQKGHSVMQFDAAIMNLNGCHHFSMPVYWYSIPGQIKNIIDKLYSFSL